MILLITALLGCLSAPWSVPLACKGKECPDMHLVPCGDVGIPEENGRGWCDECGVLYKCGGSDLLLGQTPWPCECINEDGFVETSDYFASPCYQEEP
jgi:hypothetical protein